LNPPNAVIRTPLTARTSGVARKPRRRVHHGRRRTRLPRGGFGVGPRRPPCAPCPRGSTGWEATGAGSWSPRRATRAIRQWRRCRRGTSRSRRWVRGRRSAVRVAPWRRPCVGGMRSLGWRGGPSRSWLFSVRFPCILRGSTLAIGLSGLPSETLLPARRLSTGGSATSTFPEGPVGLDRRRSEGFDRACRTGP
jgi:hypothetical protein